MVKRELAWTTYQWARRFGIDPRAAAKTVRNLGGYWRELREFKALAESAQTQMELGPMFPCLGEASAESGVGKGHYFHQDLLVARRIFARAPRRHLDVGSRIDGFVAHVAAFREIEVLDIRPLSRDIPNVKFRQADLMELQPEYQAATDSLSCLHALEHFGLGRYGDRLDPDGHLRGLAGLTDLVQTDGMLYLSVPIGRQRIEFNAHRVFGVDYMLRLIEPSYELVAFSFVDDAGDLHESVTLDAHSAASSFGCSYGCGIFELRRR
jgi:hypothetical protein